MQLYETLVKFNGNTINLSIDYIDKIELDYEDFNNQIMQEMGITG